MRALVLLPVMALLVLPAVPSVSAQAGDVPAYTYNWSGYEVTRPDVTSVTATFTVPTVSGPATVNGVPTDVSIWVGMDGWVYGSNTVEQTGVSGKFDSKTNAAVYYAWWEMYPQTFHSRAKLKISAGDSVTAAVAYTRNGRFVLSLIDNTDGRSYSKTASPSSGVERSSAEWIVERGETTAKGRATIQPLATFDSVTFAAASYATGFGAPVTLQQAYDGSYAQEILMQGTAGQGPIALDAVSGVASDSFIATFLANGYPMPYP